MAVGIPYIKCDTSGMSMETLAKALFTRNATTKKEGLRVLRVVVASAADIEPAVDCNSPVSLEAHIRNMVYLAGDGLPALLQYDVSGL